MDEPTSCAHRYGLDVREIDRAALANNRSSRSTPTLFDQELRDPDRQLGRDSANLATVHATASTESLCGPLGREVALCRLALVAGVARHFLQRLRDRRSDPMPAP